MEGLGEADIKNQTMQGVARAKDLLNSANWKPNGKKPCEKYVMDHGPRVAAKGI